MTLGETAILGARRLSMLAALLLLLPACVAGTAGAPSGGAGPGQVSRVILYPDTVTVEMRDRSLCTGPRTRVGAGWSGHLAGCKHLWPYEVRQPASRITRLPLSKGAGGTGQVTLSPPGQAVEVWSGPAGRLSG